MSVLRRVLVFALVFVLVLSFCVLPSSASGTVYFFAVDDTIYQLSDYNMPVSYGGFIYVPYTDFSTYATGVFALYEPSLSLLYLYSGSRIIYFDLANNTTYDNDGLSYPLGAVAMNGTVYVPAYLSCDFLGLSMSVTYTSVAPLLRITTGSQSLSDREMVDNNIDFMQRQYNSYYGIGDTGNNTTVTTPVETPSAGDDDDVEPVDSDDKVTLGKTSGRVFVSVHTDPENVSSVISALSGARALFYFSASEIMQDPAAVRAVLCAGCSVGIWLEDGTLEEFYRAGDLLFQAAMVTTRYVSGAQPDFDDAIYWGGSYVYSGGSFSYGGVSDVAAAIKSSTSDECVLFDTQDDPSDAVGALLRRFSTSGIDVTQIRETTSPIA